MKLGILYKNGQIVNHRSLFKVLVNPVCRYFGFCFATTFKDNKPKGLEIISCDRESIKWSWNNHNDYDRIVKVRTII